MPQPKKPRQGRKRSAGQTSLQEFGFYNQLAAERIQQKVKTAHDATEEAPITIPYRDDGRVRGTGAFWDNTTLQQITDTPTAVWHSQPDEESETAESQQQVHLGEYMRNHTTLRLPYGISNTEGITEPPILSNLEEADGLLFIPGIPRSVKDGDHAILDARVNTHNKLIADARLKGKPILAVCGGSWSLWKALDGKLETVKDHNCNNGMPRINNAGKVGYNIQIHRIRFTPEGTLLKAAMEDANYKDKNPNPPVNSVHWLAPDASTKPRRFQISALSVSDEALAPISRRGEKIKPQEGTVEAFESKYGAPIIGTLFHPEAYTINTPKQYFPQQHRSLINYMAQAGKAYKIRKKMAAELKRIQEEKGKLRTTLLKRTQLYQRTKQSYSAGKEKTIFHLSHKEERQHFSFWQREYLKETHDFIDKKAKTNAPASKLFPLKKI